VRLFFRRKIRAVFDLSAARPPAWHWTMNEALPSEPETTRPVRPDEVRLGRAGPEDLEALVGLHVDFCRFLRKTTPTAGDFRSAFAPLLCAGVPEYLLVWSGGRPAGFATLRAMTSAWSGGALEATFEDLLVRDEFRGRRLVEAVLARATELGCVAISLETNERNATTTALYRSAGFTCERPRWAGGRQIRFDRRMR
jgi:GNAT superfamily N-acetyltransferase